MKKYPDNLPKAFTLVFEEVRGKFNEQKSNWPVFERTLISAGKAGHDIVAVKTLLIGAETANSWLHHPRRLKAHKEAVAARKFFYTKQKSERGFRVQYVAAQLSAHALTMKTGEQYLSLIYYGFMLNRGATLFEDMDWEPFLDALALVLIEEYQDDYVVADDIEKGLTQQETEDIRSDAEAFNDDARIRVADAIRSRIYRVREKEKKNPERVRYLATQYFQQLYATVTEPSRWKTIRRRKREF